MPCLIAPHTLSHPIVPPPGLAGWLNVPAGRLGSWQPAGTPSAGKLYIDDLSRSTEHVSKPSVHNRNTLYLPLTSGGWY